MKFKLTFFLVIANLIVFGVLWREFSADENIAGAEHSVFTAGIKKISIAAPSDGDGDFSLVLKDRSWIVEKGFEWPANTFAVREVLRGLHFLDPRNSFSVQDALETGSNLASFGLETPTMVVRVEDMTGERELKFGKPTPDGTAVYTLLPGGKRIAPLPKSMLLTFLKSAEDFRVNEIFTVLPFEIRALTVRIKNNGGNEQRIGLKRVIKEENGAPATRRWEFETPIKVPAEPQITEEYVSKLTALSCRRFVPAQTRQNELADPVMKITLESAKKTETLIVGNAVPENPELLYAKLENNPAVFTIDRAVVSDWKRAATDLRNPYFFDFNPANLRSLEIFDKNGKTLKLERLDNGAAEETAVKEVDSGEMNLENVPAPVKKPAKTVFSTWKIRETDYAADPIALDELVESLKQLRAVGFAVPADVLPASSEFAYYQAFVSDAASQADLAALGFETPEWTVVLTRKEPSESKKIVKIARAADKKLPLHALVENSVYSIDGDLCEKLSAEPVRFRSRLVKSLAGAEFVSLKITDLADNETVVAGTFPAETKNRTLETFLKCCAEIRAESFLETDFSMNFRHNYLNADAQKTGGNDWAYKLELVYKTPSGTSEETLTLFLTKRLGGNCQYAGFENEKVFNLDQAFIDAFHALTFKNYAEKNITNIPKQ